MENEEQCESPASLGPRDAICYCGYNVEVIVLAHAFWSAEHPVPSEGWRSSKNHPSATECPWNTVHRSGHLMMDGYCDSSVARHAFIAGALAWTADAGEATIVGIIGVFPIAITSCTRDFMLLQ